MNTVTVSQLNRYVKSLLDGDGNLQQLLLAGEISNFTNHYQSGHLYMTLKDETAAVKAVMFRSQAMRLRFRPENGMKVIARVRVSLYEKDGSFQLYIDELQPDGVGALQLAFEQLKRRLESEGLFAPERKRPIPAFPKRVGVVTSPTGAALQDILNVLGRRFPMATVVHVPVLVQGEGAPADLCRALNQLERLKQTDDPNAPDVIIIGRGGGSLEELWAFNDERLARTLAAMTIPIISAVGHETDFTICDFVADLRAPTPSAAAELAVPDRIECLQQLGRLTRALPMALSNCVREKQRRLDSALQSRVFAQPLSLIEERQMQIDLLTRSFTSATEKHLSRCQKRLAELAGKLDGMSPLRVITRGYAVAETGDKVVCSVSEMTVGDTVRLRFADGQASCLVQEIVQNEKRLEP